MNLPTTPMVRFSLPGKRVCFWGAPSDLAPVGVASGWATRLTQTGGNTGNLFIGNGLFRHFEAEHKSYHPGFAVLPASKFDENFDCLVIPASNFINPALDLQDVYDYFRRTNTPIYCFGLGSQVIPNEPVTLRQGTKDFINLVSQRSASIGVRGAFTAEVLWEMGIRNINLTGCPSLMGLNDETLNLLTSKSPTLEKIATNYSNNVRGHSFNPEAQLQTENNLFSYMLDKNSFYILQNEAPELSMIDPSQQEGQPINLGIIRNLKNIFRILDENEGLFRAYLANRVRVFYDVAPWIGAMRTMTATVGSRFHGNIASILAGTPGMVLVHDMRTLELAELFSIPHLILDRIYNGEEIIERLLDVDYSAFSRRIVLLRAEWRAFAMRNGIGVI